jgi:hypothetical protein
MNVSGRGSRLPVSTSARLPLTETLGHARRAGYARVVVRMIFFLVNPVLTYSNPRTRSKLLHGSLDVALETNRYSG